MGLGPMAARPRIWPASVPVCFTRGRTRGLGSSVVMQTKAEKKKKKKWAQPAVTSTRPILRVEPIPPLPPALPSPEVPFSYGNRDPYVFLNWIKVLEEYFTWCQLKGHSCKDYAKRKLLGDAQAWWKRVECQLYQYPPTW